MSAAPASDRIAPPPAVAAQLDALEIRPGRPLVVADADEVLFLFMRGFERFLAAQALYFDWTSFALHGNIRRRADDAAVALEDVQGLLSTFFARDTEALEPVAGAAEALAALSHRADVVILSNLPLDAKPARERALKKHGMDFPLVAGHGPKGPALAALAERAAAPVFFIDDIPHNHASVAKLAPATHRLHFIADPRLSALLGPSPHCHSRFDDWPAIRAHILEQLASTGH